VINPGLRFGRYEVGARIGKGGFGVVHLARDTELGRDIAIKFLKPEYLMRPQIVQRFLQEARAAAKIGHAGIVTVFECGHVDGTGLRVDGTAFIAMELLRGESLADRLLNGGRMSAGKAIAIGRQLADALGAAHAASIIHRDLKPDNVFLVPDAAAVGGERVKVLDFGVAKLAEPADLGVDTHSQVLLGTPRYMSPEQSRSATKIDTRSDVYALGCMLFELVAGRAPFDGDAGDLIAKHQRDPAPDLRARAPVPEPYAALVAQMLEKSPDARPQTMARVGAALAAMDGSHAAPPAAILAPVAEAEATIVHDSTIRRRRIRLAYVGGALLVAAGIALAIGLGGSRPDVAVEPRDAGRALAAAPPPSPPPPPPPPPIDAGSERDAKPAPPVDAATSPAPAARPRHVVAPAPATDPPPCNATALHARGNQDYRDDRFADAMAAFLKAYECSHAAIVLGRAIQAGCKAGKAAEARAMFAKLPRAVRIGDTGINLAQMCLGVGIDLRP